MKTLPPPRDWQDFEDLCFDLWKRIWKDDSARKHGSAGECQDGVDIYGMPFGGRDWHGVQCKLKEEGRLTRGQVEQEIEKARLFNPKLSSLTFATTAKRSAETQKMIRELNDREIATGGFAVSLSAWQDISELVQTEHQDLIPIHFSRFIVEKEPAEVGADIAVRPYLQELWAELMPVQLVGVRTGRSAGKKDVLLSEIYTALNVTAELEVARGGDEPVFGLSYRARFLAKADEACLDQLLERLKEEAEKAQAKERRKDYSYRRRLTALEAVAVTRRLVLLGAPGGGKSTFARYLALCFAGEMMRPKKARANLERLDDRPMGEGESAASVWPHGSQLPLFVELRKLVRHRCFDEEETDRCLLAFLKKRCSAEDFSRFLDGALSRQGEGVMLILDGLDEIPAAGHHRERIRAMVDAWTLAYPRCRVLVTSRPYAYRENSPWRLDDSGFAEVTPGALR